MSSLAYLTSYRVCLCSMLRWKISLSWALAPLISWCSSLCSSRHFVIETRGGKRGCPARVCTGIQFTSLFEFRVRAIYSTTIDTAMAHTYTGQPKRHNTAYRTAWPTSRNTTISNLLHKETTTTRERERDRMKQQQEENQKMGIPTNIACRLLNLGCGQHTPWVPISIGHQLALVP